MSIELIIFVSGIIAVISIFKLLNTIGHNNPGNSVNDNDAMNSMSLPLQGKIHQQRLNVQQYYNKPMPVVNLAGIDNISEIESDNRSEIISKLKDIASSMPNVDILHFNNSISRVYAYITEEISKANLKSVATLISSKILESLKDITPHNVSVNRVRHTIIDADYRNNTASITVNFESEQVHQTSGDTYENYTIKEQWKFIKEHKQDGREWILSGKKAIS